MTCLTRKLSRIVGLLFAVMFYTSSSGCDSAKRPADHVESATVSSEISDEEPTAPEELSAEELRRRGEILDVAVLINDHYDEVGQFWMGVLNDNRRSVEDRILAVRTLGQIRYSKAIPLLIQNVQMANPADASSNGATELPAVEALGRFGAGVVPHLVNAYLFAADEDRRKSLGLALSATQAQKQAYIYLKGLQVTGDKRVTEKHLDEFRKRFGISQ